MRHLIATPPGHEDQVFAAAFSPSGSTLRCRTVSWCRSAAFSASSRLFDLNGEANRVRKKQRSVIIAADV